MQVIKSVGFAFGSLLWFRSFYFNSSAQIDTNTSTSNVLNLMVGIIGGFFVAAAYYYHEQAVLEFKGKRPKSKLGA